MLAGIRMRSWVVVIAVSVLILLILVEVTSFFRASKTISSFGSVKTVGVGVYWDSTLTDRVSYVDWGTVEPGANSSVRVYVQNEGNIPVNLSLNTINWTPSTAQSYLGLDWDYEGQTLEVGDACQVTLTLSIPLNISGISSFSFDIVIAGVS